jgi:hypothetical protein
MPLGTLTWVNLFADDIDALSQFYILLFEFTEVPEMRNPVFRGVSTGGSNIGFMDKSVYGILQLEDQRRDEGSRSLLNVEVATTEEVDRLTQEAVGSGARLVKEAGITSYGWYQSVLLDPEGNVFRINKMLGAVRPASPVTSPN